VTSPDLIGISTPATANPIRHGLEEGMEVAVLGARADEKYRSREAVAIGSPYFGFDLNYVPIERYYDNK